MDLGSIITATRKSRGITQEELAEKCGVKQAYLSLIENNKREPNLSTLKEISAALQVPVPVMFFMAMNQDDVPENKRLIYEAIKPSMDGLIESIFFDDTSSDNK